MESAPVGNAQAADQGKGGAIDWFADARDTDEAGPEPAPSGAAALPAAESTLGAFLADIWRYSDKRVLVPLGTMVLAAAVALTVTAALGSSPTAQASVAVPAPKPAPGAPHPPALSTVRGVVGSEKMAFFEDRAVIDEFARQGVSVSVDSAGSRQMAMSMDLSHDDFAFPSSEPAAELIQRQHGITSKYIPFSSPMAIATFRPIANLLTSAGVVKPGPTTTFDVSRYLDLAADDTRWDQLGGHAAYPVHKKILVSTTDPRSSNSAAMYIAIASYVANGDSIVEGSDAEQAILPVLAKLFAGQGHTDNSSAGPFAAYLSDGMGPTPLVLIYEAQFVDAAIHGRTTPDMVLVYPSPTVLSRHTLVPLDAAGDRIGQLLTTDPELQLLAAEHGFRTSDRTQFATVTASHAVPVPTDLLDVIDTPTDQTMEHLITGVAKAYN